jgi:hypothetical protein
MSYLGRQPLVGNYQVLDAIVATTTDTYALTKDTVAVFPQTPSNCIVSLNGVIQAPVSSYTISGSNIVFDSALTGSDSIDFITVLGDVLSIGTPTDGTVTTAKLVDSSVTTAKLNDGSVSLAKLTATGTKDATTFLRGDNTFDTPAGGLFSSTAFSAYRTTGVTLPDVTHTTIPYNAEYFDSNSAFNISTGTYTIPTTGNYLLGVDFNISDGNGNMSDVIISLYVNGSTRSYIHRTENTSNGTHFTEYSNSWIGVKDFSAGDTVVIQAYVDTNNSSSTTFLGVSTFTNQFWGILIN